MLRLKAVWDQIRKLLAKGKTILLTTHYLQEARVGHSRCGDRSGREIIAEGRPSEIKAQTAGKQIRA